MTQWASGSDDVAERVAEQLSRFGGHLVDGLEAVRDLVVAAVQELGDGLHRELRTHSTRLDAMQAQLASASEISVAEAEGIAAVAHALRDIGRGDDGGVTRVAHEVAQMRAACVDIQQVVADLGNQLSSLQDELEQLRAGLESDTGTLVPNDSDQELTRLATEVRLLRRRIQLQAAPVRPPELTERATLEAVPPADAADGAPSGRRPLRARRAGEGSEPRQ